MCQYVRNIHSVAMYNFGHMAYATANPQFLILNAIKNAHGFASGVSQMHNNFSTDKNEKDLKKFNWLAV